MTYPIASRLQYGEIFSSSIFLLVIIVLCIFAVRSFCSQESKKSYVRIFIGVGIFQFVVPILLQMWNLAYDEHVSSFSGMFVTFAYLSCALAVCLFLVKKFGQKGSHRSGIIFFSLLFLYVLIFALSTQFYTLTFIGPDYAERNYRMSFVAFLYLIGLVYYLVVCSRYFLKDRSNSIILGISYGFVLGSFSFVVFMYSMEAIFIPLLDFKYCRDIECISIVIFPFAAIGFFILGLIAPVLAFLSSLLKRNLQDQKEVLNGTGSDGGVVSSEEENV